MTAITNQISNARRRIVELQKQRLALHPERATETAIALTANLAGELTLKDLQEWQRQLEALVKESEG